MPPKPVSKKVAKKKGSRVAETGKAVKLLQRSKVTRTLMEAESGPSGTGPLPILPVYSYKSCENPPIAVYTRNEEEVNDLVGTLRGCLGFDMEWIFYRLDGKTVLKRTALIQIADDRTILLVQLSGMNRFPSELKVSFTSHFVLSTTKEAIQRVIESPDVVKLGVGIRGDGQKLYQDYGILARGLVDLSSAARDADPAFAATYIQPEVALAKMVEFYEKKHLLKGRVRMSNWEKRTLTPEQIEYAANDAYCAVQMYSKICGVSKKAGKTLTLSRHTVDFEHEYQSGRLDMLTTPSTISPKYQRARHEPTCQELRAYTLWHVDELSLVEICIALGSTNNPLQETTVIAYVVNALHVDATLAFSLPKLKELVQEEIKSWSRHGWWIHQLDARNRVQANSASTSGSQHKHR